MIKKSLKSKTSKSHTWAPLSDVAPCLVACIVGFSDFDIFFINSICLLALISKLCRNLVFGKRENKFYRKTWTWKILQKIFFLRKKIFGNFLMQEFYTFLKSAQNSASFDTLYAQLWRNFFSTLRRDGAVFLKLKAQIRYKPFNILKNVFFYKLVLGFQGQTKITCSKVI